MVITAKAEHLPKPTFGKPSPYVEIYFANKYHGSDFFNHDTNPAIEEMKISKWQLAHSTVPVKKSCDHTWPTIDDATLWSLCEGDFNRPILLKCWAKTGGNLIGQGETTMPELIKEAKVFLKNPKKKKQTKHCGILYVKAEIQEVPRVSSSSEMLVKTVIFDASKPIGLGLNKNNTVKDIVPGGVAEINGVKNGWTIITVNQKPVGNTIEMIQAAMRTGNLQITFETDQATCGRIASLQDDFVHQAFKKGEVGTGYRYASGLVSITWNSGKKSRTVWPNPDWYSGVPLIVSEGCFQNTALSFEMSVLSLKMKARVKKNKYYIEILPADDEEKKEKPKPIAKSEVFQQPSLNVLETPCGRFEIPMQQIKQKQTMALFEDYSIEIRILAIPKGGDNKDEKQIVGNVTVRLQEILSDNGMGIIIMPVKKKGKDRGWVKFEQGKTIVIHSR